MRGRDGGLCGQRVCPERADGLSAAGGDGKAGGNSSPAEAVHTGGSGRWSLRRGGVSARVGFPGRPAGEGRGGRTDGPGGLWGRGAVSSAGAAALRRLQRHGGSRAGPGPAGRRRNPGGKRRVLHGCERQGPADCRGRGLSGAGGGVPDLGQARGGRQAAPCSNQCRGAHRRADGPVGHGERPSGAGERTAGAGGGSRRAGRPADGGDAAAAGAGGAARPGGSSGAPQADLAGAASPPPSLPGGGDGGRASAGGAHGLDGGGRDQVSRPDGGVVPHGAGKRVCGPLGRRSQKRRRPWKRCGRASCAC